MYTVEDYKTADGCIPFKDWLSELADRQAKTKIFTRVERMKAGNLGDCKPVQEGV